MQASDEDLDAHGGTTMTDRPYRLRIALPALAAAVLALNACQEQELNPLSPDIFVSPESIDFGTVSLGAPAHVELEIHNVGGGTLAVDSVLLADGTGPFVVGNYTGNIGPNEMVVVGVDLDPAELGGFQDVIEITSDDPDEPVVEVPVIVQDVIEGPAAAIAWSPSSLDYGAVPSGGALTLTVTITSVGTGDLEVSAIELQTGTSPEFTLDVNPAPVTMPPSYSEQIDVTYTPDDDVDDAGTLLIHCNDPDTPLVEIPLTGALQPAPDIELIPTQLLFGDVPIGSSVTMESEIWSLGADTLELGTLTLIAGTEFVIDVDPSGAVLDPGDSTTVTVTYTPTDMTADVGEIEIPSNDPDENPATLLLAGQHEPIPDIEVDPLSVDFGTVDVGTTSSDQVLVSNVGTGDLQVDMPVLTGSTDFAISAAQFPISIPAGGAEIVLVDYSPSDFTDDTGEITITSDDPDEPTVVVALLGAHVPAPDIDLQPTSLQFGQVMVGYDLTLSADITNVGTADLVLGTLAVVGTSEYTLTVDPSGMVLAPGNATALYVTYTPVDSGSDVATVEIPSNDPDENPVYLDLNGAELPVPDIDVDPLIYDFGAVDVFTSTNTDILVSNVGSADLDVTAVTLSGSTEFSFLSSSLPGTLGIGASTNVYVEYAPVDQTADTATLTFESDDPDEPTVTVTLTGEPAPTPDIDVDPWTVDFGDVKLGDSDTAWVTIYNVGAADLELYNISRSGDPNFSITTNPQGTTVAPGGSTLMEISFWPTAEQAYSAVIDIVSNDPFDQTVSVDVYGDGATSEIEVDPDYWDFGNVYYGCDDNVDITIRSVGSAPLTIHGYSYTTMPGQTMFLDADDLDDYLNNGWDLDPGDEIVLNLEFEPTNLMAFSGLLEINSDAANLGVAQADQDGVGVAGGSAMDNWVQVGNNQSDVLWVVDNSCSMGDEQGFLSDDFGYFYSVVSGAGVDFRIATVTTDDEDFVGTTKVISPTTPNGGAVFSSNCLVGTTGSANERGLMYGYNALTDAINGNYPNTGFWRQDAGLRVVYVSDESDQSGSWSTYLSYYQALKADPSYVILSSICGTDGYTAQSCSGPGGSAYPGTGYVDVANATGGVLASICDSDWSTALTNLAWMTVNLEDTFELTYTPITTTIEVYVNGGLVGTGWSYDAGQNAVVFSPSFIPQDGDVIQILYDYYGSC